MTLGEALAHVEDAITRAMASDLDLLAMASEHVISSGGKRLRPKVLLLCFEAAGGADMGQSGLAHVVPLAAAVELLHTASLVHDDINDRSNLRRGRATVNSQWGDSLALLVGDFIFVKLLKLVAPFDQEILCSFADASIAIVEGETRQALSLGNLDLNEESYLRIVKEKTAALFSASAKMGALAAEAPDTQVAALRTYGLNLGIAFQIRDDTLDVTGKRNKLGKPVGNDLGQNKMSLATIFAREKLGEQYDTLCRENRAEQLLREIGALGYAMGQADRYIEQAKEALAALPHSEAREALFELADFAVSRFR